MYMLFFSNLRYLPPIDLFLKISAFAITLKLSIWEQQDQLNRKSFFYFVFVIKKPVQFFSE